jgi:hypothetical protein
MVGSMKRLVACGLCGLCVIVAVCSVGILMPGGSSGASGSARIAGTWMAGPGCGAKAEWFQHPAWFPYFCDGAAYVEKAHWRRWGAARAKASATMNEAVLTGHNSVGTAPRSRSPVTVVASHVERCGTRRAYKSVVIRFDDPHKGQPKKLKLASFLRCPKAPTAHPPTPTTAEFRTRPGGGFVGCAMYAESRTQIGGVRCQGNPQPSEGEEPLVQVAKLQADGQVFSCSRLAAVDDRCELGNLGEPIPTYAPGKRVHVGAFACDVLEAGVECTVVASGRGFLITPDEVTTVGG